jgi:hypothetical protein
VLMTKFDESEKIDNPVYGSGYSNFDSFRVDQEKKITQGNLKI